MSGSVLIVHDDAPFRRSLRARLEARGWHVEETTTGGGALRFLGAPQGLVVVVGAQLPDMSGLSFLGRFRRRRPEDPVVLVFESAREQDVFADLASEVGVSFMVHRPLDGSEFAERLVSMTSVHSETTPTTARDSATALPKGFDAELRTLTSAYVSELPGKLEAIAKALVRTRGAGDPSSRVQAAQLAHRLRGTAGTYGLPDIGVEAGRIEDALRADERDEGQPAEPVDWPMVNDALGKLQRLVAATVPLPPVEESSPLPAMLPKECVLVVDDDPDFLRAMVRIGKFHLVEVLPARTAEEALGVATRRRPDVIFLDVDLGDGPDESFELARRFRELPGETDPSLVFVSANSAAENRIGAARAGATLFLRKPLDGASFVATVRQLSAQRRVDRPRIVLVDGDEGWASSVSTSLADAGMAVEALPAVSSLVPLLDRAPPAVALVDWDLQRFGGFDVCRMIRTAPRWQSTPILCVSRRVDLETRLSAFQAGADDLLQRPIAPRELLARLSVTVDRARLLSHRMDRDGLTGLLLRRPFYESLVARLSEAQRHGKPLALALLDLDHFKQVNDERGHLTGDRVLAAFGRLLTSSFRAEDVCGRWGGEEFVVAFPGEEAASIAGALERVLEEFSAIDFHDDHGRTFHVTFSAGVASAHADASTVHRLVRAADRRLYAAKKRGRARIVSTDSP